MNCPECRKHLYPYLDSELGVTENLAILEHLNACRPCGELFSSEERAWTRVRSALRSEHASSAWRSRLPTLLGDGGTPAFRARVAAAAWPAAAAAVLLAALLLDRPDPHTPSPPNGGSSAHGPRDHGPGIEAAVDDFLGLEDPVPAAHHGLDPDLLLARSIRYEELDGAAVQRFYQRLFGDAARLPAEILAPEVRGAARTVAFPGTAVSNLTLDLQDRRIGVYHLKREDAALRDMRLIDEGVTTGVRIERCKSCYAIAVTRGDDVYILVSRQGVEPLIAMARQSF